MKKEKAVTETDTPLSSNTHVCVCVFPTLGAAQVHEVTDEDNIKQDKSIDVYGRFDEEEEGK